MHIIIPGNMEMAKNFLNVYMKGVCPREDDSVGVFCFLGDKETLRQ